MRFEGWMQGKDSRPSFETPRALRRKRAAESAAPQDEVLETPRIGSAGAPPRGAPLRKEGGSPRCFKKLL
jgi:hypothetical protein